MKSSLRLIGIAPRVSIKSTVECATPTPNSASCRPGRTYLHVWLCVLPSLLSWLAFVHLWHKKLYHLLSLLVVVPVVPVLRVLPVLLLLLVLLQELPQTMQIAQTFSQAQRMDCTALTVGSTDR